MYRWNGYVESEGVRSLLQHVEAHGERLRRKYLAWIHELGDSRIAGRRLVEHLELDAGLSYWWMTLLVEKSPWKTPSINDAIRLLALEEVVAQHSPATLRVVTADRRIRDAVADLCRNLGIVHEWHRPAGNTSRRTLKFADVYRALPRPVRALASLGRHVVSRWPLRRADERGWLQGPGARFFCSYFIHLDPQSCNRGEFYSRQWEGLPGMLSEAGFGTNWLQHYLPSSAVPDTTVALNWVRGFNRGQPPKAFHTFLDSYLSAGRVLRVLGRWLKLILIGWRLRSIRGAFQPPGSRLSLWPVMRADWRDCLSGPAAVINLLWIELFDAALRGAPRQALGLYVLEGQSWERAFIHAWRKYGHGKLIGTAHSTVRFWDLRYFADPRTVRATGPCAMPQPDLTALNGKAAIDAFRSVEFPEASMVECEAVRFGYLQGLGTRVSGRRSNGGPVRVLILGDVMSASTDHLLSTLAAAVGMQTATMAYTVKPHPNCMVRPQDYPSLSLQVLTDPLAGILRDFDVACASNSTSAGLDAYLAGLPVVVMLDETELNVSPLRGQPGVRFVSTAQELAVALRAAAVEPRAGAARDEFFFLDSQLPRWRQLLEPANA